MSFAIFRGCAVLTKLRSSTRVLVKGLISKPTTGSGRGTSDRQFFYVNGRPFLPSKVSLSSSSLQLDG